MLGWEFPPFISGGLGTACYGLTKAMSRRGDRIVFVLPGPARIGFSAAYDPQNRPNRGDTPLTMAEFENVEFHGIEVQGGDPYSRSPHTQRRGIQAGPVAPALPFDIVGESRKFTQRAAELAARQRQHGRHFDVVHAHEWMTFEAGNTVARLLGVPFIAHVHSTESDRRAGDVIDQRIRSAESAGLASADAIIAVSRYTAEMLARDYGLDRDRVTVIHNGLEVDCRMTAQSATRIAADERIVLFVGRMTPQKGPESFVRAAARVLQQQPAVRFVMAGAGQMLEPVRQLARQLEIEQAFLFTGFLDDEDLDSLYRAADVLVMPSLSEPFGLVSLEAMARQVPVIVSRQSGAAEVLKNVLKVDSWDADDISAKILAVLNDPAYARDMGSRGSFEVRQMLWSDAADAVARVYDRLLHGDVAA